MPPLSDLASRPRVVLPALVLLHWLCVAAFALSVRHNGWVWYQGGDQIWYTTSGWLLGNGELPPTRVGYGWPYLLAPITILTGRGFVAAMPLVIALNVLVLAPVAIGCVYWIARHLAGWVAGLWAALLWVALPYLAIPLFRDDYHERFVEQFLPQALGLSGLADYPSAVCLLAAAALVLRALASRAPADALLAGVVTGFAVAIKPANVLFLAGPALAFLLARRPRAAAVFAAGLGPALVALHWDVFQSNMDSLREWFWSARMLQYAPFAGTFAVARRSLPAAGLLAGWFFAIAVVKGASVDSTVESGSFFRFLMPGYPAYLLLLAFIPALVPTLLRRFDPDDGVGDVGPKTLGAAVVLLAIVPIGAVALARPLERGDRAVLVDEILTPVDPDLGARIEADGAARVLRWNPRETGPTAVFYRVFRSGTAPDELACVHEGAASCSLTMVVVGTTREPRFRDDRAPAGAQYRVGVGTNWRNDPTGGDVFSIGPPAAPG
jgi:hypothetical protein